MRPLRLLALGVVLAALLPPASARATVAVVVVTGRGWGHGVGLAQDGAYWMGQDGRSAGEILDHFYPGTTRGSATGDVRVVVHVAAEPTATLVFPDGGEVRSPRAGPQRAGFPVRVGRGGAVTITHDGSTYRVAPAGGVAAASASGAAAQPIELPTSSTSSTSSTSTTSTTLLPGPPSTTTTSTPPSPTSAPPNQPPPTEPTPGVTSPEPVWAGPVTADASIEVPVRSLRYRGELEVSAAGGPLRVINQLDVEQYLWGLAEVSASWSQESLRAQIVAARTYAMRAMAANGELCDTQRCQVYKGRNGEFRGQVDAVNATLGTVLGYGGRHASTVYSANAAGVSATPEEGFGTPSASHPYLRAAPYVTRSDDPWEVRIALADLAERLGYAGNASSVRVAKKGPSGRALTIELDGDAGTLAVPALEADAAMGLRSTMWSLRVEQADEAPPPPDAEDRIQALPDDVGTVIADEQQQTLRRASRFDRADAESASGPDAPAGDGSDAPWLLIAAVLTAGAAGVIVLRRAEHRPLALATRPTRRAGRLEPLRAERASEDQTSSDEA